MSLVSSTPKTRTRKSSSKQSHGFANSDHTWIARFDAFLDDNMDSDLLNIPELAEEFAMSESTLLRQVKRITGLPPVSYIQNKRMEKAYSLLQSEYYDSVQEVAMAVGYQHTGSFSRTFKQRFGILPSEMGCAA